MKPSWMILALAALAIWAAPASGGQLLWTPGGDGPALVLSLGDGVIKKTLSLPSGTSTLVLTLRKHLSPDATLRLRWKADGQVWVTTVKKIPGAEVTERVTLPPGRQLVLEISTLGGESEAVITLRRN